MEHVCTVWSRPREEIVEGPSRQVAPSASGGSRRFAEGLMGGSGGFP